MISQVLRDLRKGKTIYWYVDGYIEVGPELRYPGGKEVNAITYVNEWSKKKHFAWMDSRGRIYVREKNWRDVV